VKIRDTSAPSLSWSGTAKSDITKTIGIMLWQCEVTGGLPCEAFLLPLAAIPLCDTYTDNCVVMQSVCQCLKKSKLRHTLRLCCFLRAFCDLIRAFLLSYSDTFRGIVAVRAVSGNYRHHNVIVMSQTFPC